MAKTEEVCSIRDCAAAVIDAIARAGDDGAALRDGLLAATRPFLQRPDLFSLGARRPGNHIDNSKYIYYDGEVSITLDELPHGLVVPPHDHGVWEALVIVKGRLHHAVYDRVDDGSVDGHAELKTIEDRECTPGELAMVIPPAEIHSFTALEPETYILTIVGGNYSPKRHYYNVEKQTCIVAQAGKHKNKDAA